MNARKYVSLSIALALSSAMLSAQSADAIIDRMSVLQHVDSMASEISMIIYPDRFDENDSRTFSMLTYSRGDEDSYMVF